MKIREGYYILSRPDNPITEAESMAMLQFLSDDIQSAAPQVRWGFHPTRSNLCVFAGGLDGGKHHFVFEKAPIKGGYQVIFNYFDGPKSRYTIVDLCLGPRSELQELYGYVSRAVRDAAWRERHAYCTAHHYHRINGVLPKPRLVNQPG